MFVAFPQVIKFLLCMLFKPTTSKLLPFPQKTFWLCGVYQIPVSSTLAVCSSLRAIVLLLLKHLLFYLTIIACATWYFSRPITLEWCTSWYTGKMDWLHPAKRTCALLKFHWEQLFKIQVSVMEVSPCFSWSVCGLRFPYSIPLSLPGCVGQVGRGWKCKLVPLSLRSSSDKELCRSASPLLHHLNQQNICT